MKDWFKTETIRIAEQLAGFDESESGNTYISSTGVKQQVYDLLSQLKCALFPVVYETDKNYDAHNMYIIHKRVNESAMLLNDILKRLYQNIDEKKSEDDIKMLTKEYIQKLPYVREMLDTDIQAAFRGDPAAKSLSEIMLSYPCMEAVSVFRLAHELWIKGVPLIPRIMTEYAHAQTGIDIHPGAEIGKSFFIDHGTGVVIGETCIIGENVKLYQGVTLGAKSFVTNASGEILDVKRHPNIEDNVVIYSGATILGGDTTVGHDSIIGGNVWLTKSVPPYSVVYNSTPEPFITDGSKDKYSE